MSSSVIASNSSKRRSRVLGSDDEGDGPLPLVRSEAKTGARLESVILGSSALAEEASDVGRSASNPIPVASDETEDGRSQGDGDAGADEETAVAHFDGLVEEGSRQDPQLACFALTIPVYAPGVDGQLNPTPMKLFEGDYTELVYQQERGKPTEKNPEGYLHWQVALKLKKKTRWATLVSRIKFTGAHVMRVTKRPGVKNAWEAIKNYCRKTDKPGAVEGTVFDVSSESVEKTPKKKKREGEQLYDWVQDWVAEKHTMPTYQDYCITFKNMAIMHGSKPFANAVAAHGIGTQDLGPKLCIALWGDTGTGKSWWAQQWARKRGLTFFRKPASQWWCGYQGEDVVIFDDARWQGDRPTMTYAELLVLTQAGPATQWQTKGGHVWVTAKVFIFTHPAHPKEWFYVDHQKGDSEAQLLRRLKSGGIYHMKAVYKHKQEILINRWAKPSAEDFPGCEVDEEADESIFQPEKELEIDCGERNPEDDFLNADYE